MFLTIFRIKWLYLSEVFEQTPHSVCTSSTKSYVLLYNNIYDNTQIWLFLKIFVFSHFVLFNNSYDFVLKPHNEWAVWFQSYHSSKFGNAGIWIQDSLVSYFSHVKWPTWESQSCQTLKRGNLEVTAMYFIFSKTSGLFLFGQGMSRALLHF